MDLEYTWGGIVFNTENKEDADTCKGRDASWKDYAKWSKSIKIDHTLVHSICVNSLEQANQQNIH